MLLPSIYLRRLPHIAVVQTLLKSTPTQLTITSPYSTGSSNETQNEPSPVGVFKYAQVPNKSYIQIRGPDTPKFLNGLVTSKLLPHFIKKNLTTIETDKGKTTREDSNMEVPEFDMTKGNWGLYQENSSHGPYISRFAQYTALLNGKGKLITDCILYPYPILSNDENSMKYPSYLLELNASINGRIMDALENHKLTSKIKFENLSPKSVKTWDVSIQFQNIPQNAENPWIDNIITPTTMMKTPNDAIAFTHSVISTLFKGNEESIKAMYVERRTDDILQLDGSAPQLFRIITSHTVEDISKLFNTEALSLIHI